MEVGHHYYSVPYQLVGQALDARYTATIVEIFHRGVRVASHRAQVCPLYGHHATPASAQESSGPSGVDSIEIDQLGGNDRAGHRQSGANHPGEQAAPGSRVSFLPGHYRLGEKLYWGAPGSGQPRALLLGVYSYQSLKSILKHALDRQPTLELEGDRSGPNHNNVRGAEYYKEPPNLLLQ